MAGHEKILVVVIFDNPGPDSVKSNDFDVYLGPCA
jgi:hypothetical protein